MYFYYLIKLSFLQKLSLKQIWFCCLFFCTGILFFAMVYNTLLCGRIANILFSSEEEFASLRPRPRNSVFYYDSNSSIIFVGGMPFSGTEILQHALDLHPNIRCGERTQIVPSILLSRKILKRSSIERKWLSNAGISNGVFDLAIRTFILEIIANHGPPAPILCNGDEHVLNYSVYLSRLFPNSKYVLLLRDGRSSVLSFVSHNHTKTTYECSDIQNCLRRWGDRMEYMYAQCLYLGKDRCLPVHFEHLDLYPKLMLKRIYDFLGLPWISSLLYYQRHILQGSKTFEKRTTFGSNTSNISDTVSKYTSYNDTGLLGKKTASVLQTLGYDPDVYPQDYRHLNLNVPDKNSSIHRIIKFLKKRENDYRQKHKCIYLSTDN